MRLEFINEYTIINRETNKVYSLDNIGKKFVETYIQYGEKDIAVEVLAKYYNIDCGLIKKDYFDFLQKINVTDEFAIGELPYNNYIVLEPTNECSGNCLHCFQRNITKYSWDNATIDSIIELLKKENIKYVSLTGGEIFSPHYVENAKYLIEMLNKHDIKIATISTNGMFINLDLMRWLKKNINIDTTTFRISLDSVDEEVIKKLRPGYKKQYNEELWGILDNSNINIVVTTIIYKQSVEEIIDIAKFISNYSGVKKWLLKPLIPTKIAHQKLSLEWGKISNIYINILEFYRNNKEKINYEFVLGNVISKNILDNPKLIQNYDLLTHPCKDEKNQKTIKASQEITRCPILSEIDNKYLIGLDKISKNNSVIFDDIKIQDMKCKECKYMKICGGGCRAYAISYGQGELGCDLNARKMWSWITNEEYFKIYWPDVIEEIKDRIT